ncbi:MAG: glycosyltransferase [Bacteroidota bacterium]
METNLPTAVLFCPTKNWGGIEKNVRLRAQYLGAKGYLIYIVVLENTFEDRFQGLNNVVVKTIISRGGDLNASVILNYYRFLRKIKPKVVFASLKRDWWLVTVAARWARVPQVILYLGNKRKIRNGLKYHLVFNTFKAKVLVNSESLRTHLLENSAFFSYDNVFRIYNGINLPGCKHLKLISWSFSVIVNHSCSL